MEIHGRKVEGTERNPAGLWKEEEMASELGTAVRNQLSVWEVSGHSGAAVE